MFASNADTDLGRNSDGESLAGRADGATDFHPLLAAWRRAAEHDCPEMRG